MPTETYYAPVPHSKLDKLCKKLESAADAREFYVALNELTAYLTAEFDKQVRLGAHGVPSVPDSRADTSLPSTEPKSHT